MNNTRILVVEDEFITAENLRNTLIKMGYEVPVTVDNGEEAVQQAGELRPDVVLMDIILIGKMTGIEAAEKIQKLYDIPCIYLTAHSDDDTIEKAKLSEPFGFIVKPFDKKTLQITIEMALYKHAMDEQLKESLNTIQTLLNTTTDSILLLDNEGNVLAMNDALAKRFKTTAAGKEGRTVHELVAAGIITPRIAEEELRARSGTNAHFTEQAGSSWFENNLYPILNSHGAVIRIAVYSHDITSMKEWEQKMEEVNAQLLSERQEILKFSTIVENMDDSVIITDGTGIIQYVNTAFRKKFGFAPEEIQGKHFNEIQAPDNRFPVSREVFIGSSKDVWNGSFIAKNKFGIKLNTGLKSTPIIKDRNTVNRVFVLREQI